MAACKEHDAYIVFNNCLALKCHGKYSCCMRLPASHFAPLPPATLRPGRGHCHRCMSTEPSNIYIPISVIEELWNCRAHILIKEQNHAARALWFWMINSITLASSSKSSASALILSRPLKNRVRMSSARIPLPSTDGRPAAKRGSTTTGTSRPSRNHRAANPCSSTKSNCCTRSRTGLGQAACRLCPVLGTMLASLQGPMIWPPRVSNSLNANGCETSRKSLAKACAWRIVSSFTLLRRNHTATTISASMRKEIVTG